MKISKIRPIPKNVLKLIRKKDKELYPKPTSLKRFYSYLTKNDGELVKVTVAVKHKFTAWYCKQVAVHGIDSDYCLVRDMETPCISSYLKMISDLRLPFLDTTCCRIPFSKKLILLKLNLR